MAAEQDAGTAEFYISVNDLVAGADRIPLAPVPLGSSVRGKQNCSITNVLPA
jgi:hypothetical protein